MNAERSIGGHFSAFLENRKNRLPGAHGYESARSALYAYLTAVRPRRVFIPNYICDAVTAAATAAGTECVRYAINEQFQPAEILRPSDNEYVLLVNYFGLCAEAIRSSLENLPAEQVIVDCSQAYFFDDGEHTTKIYSARKFLPVADGGFVKAPIELPKSAPDNQSSIRRYKYLLERTVSEPEASRSHYLQAEKELESLSDREISDFTKIICETVDTKFIQSRRRENFGILEALNSINSLQFSLNDQTPLCYPLMLDDGQETHECLLKMRIFTPRYWPCVTPMNEFEDKLLHNTVFLPIDHRYAVDQMNLMLEHLPKLNRQGD